MNSSTILSSAFVVGSKSPCLASLSVSHSQAYWYPPGFLIAIRLYIHYEKGPRVCHAERQRSIWSHQPGGVAHADASLSLSMTRQRTILMPCYIRSGVDYLACPVALGAVVVEVGADAVTGVGGDFGIGDGTGKSVVAGVAAAQLFIHLRRCQRAGAAAIEGDGIVQERLCVGKLARFVGTTARIGRCFAISCSAVHR